MLTPRFIASLCAVSLLTVSCMPNTSTPAGPNTPAAEAPVTATLTTDVILTQKSGGVENPITPEQIQSIQVGNRVVQKSDIEIVKGDFKTQMDDNSEFKVQYVMDANGELNVGVFRLLSQFGAFGKVEVTYTVNGETKTISFVAGSDTTGASDADNLRITVNEDGTLVGGVANADGTLDDSKPKFKTTTDQKLEVIADGKKTTFDLSAAADTEAELKAESTTDASEEDKAAITSAPISPINLYVGNWKANLLGKEIRANIQDAGSGSVTGTATVDGSTYSASANYATSATNSERLDITAGTDAGATLKFEASIQQQNELVLTLKDAGGDARFASFVNIPVTLQRDI